MKKNEITSLKRFKNFSRTSTFFYQTLSTQYTIQLIFKELVENWLITIIPLGSVTTQESTSSEQVATDILSDLYYKATRSYSFGGQDAPYYDCSDKSSSFEQGAAFLVKWIRPGICFSFCSSVNIVILCDRKTENIKTLVFCRSSYKILQQNAHSFHLIERFLQIFQSSCEIHSILLRLLFRFFYNHFLRESESTSFWTF